jgi:hypothetical protein
MTGKPSTHPFVPDVVNQKPTECAMCGRREQAHPAK